MFLSELKERRGKAAWAYFTVAYSKVLSKGQLHAGRRAEKNYNGMMQSIGRKASPVPLTIGLVA